MLKEHYEKNVKISLISRFRFKNVNLIPKISKVVLHSTGTIEPNLGLELISGQKAIITRAHKSNAGFKIRQNQILGAKVTLRKHTAYHFLDRFVIAILPNLLSQNGSLIFKQRDSSLTIQCKPDLFNPEISVSGLAFKSVDVAVVTTGSTNIQTAALLNAATIPSIVNNGGAAPLDGLLLTSKSWSVPKKKGPGGKRGRR